MSVTEDKKYSDRRYHLALLSCTWDVEFMTRISDGLRRRLDREDISFHLFQTSDTENWNLAVMKKEAELFSLFDPERYDALIIAANASANFEAILNCARSFQKTGKPVICISTQIDESLPNIGVNDFRAMYLMTEHLITKHAARSFRYVSGPENVGDSRCRLEGFLQCLKDHSLPFHLSQLYYGNFTLQSGTESYRCFSDHQLPPVDAVVFANDGMAVGYCDAARKDGLVPGKDFLVTGFDNAPIADGYLPAICTVGQDLEGAAYHAADRIMQILKEEDGLACAESSASVSGSQLEETPAPAKMIPGTEKMIFRSSCGCPWTRDYREDYEALNRRFDARASLNHHLRMAVQELLTLSSPEQIGEALPRFLKLVGLDHFAIVLNSSIWTDESVRSLRGYEDHMLFCSDAGFISDFPASDLYPAFWEEASTAHKGMVFLPLYDRNITLGYLITYLQEHLYEMLYFRTLTGHLSIALEAVRQRYLLSLASQKLDRLSITDALTGLYNRFGYARFHKEYFDSHEGKVAVVIADLVDLLEINDRGGHDDGDYALMCSAQALRAAFGKDSIYVRIGGDEFLILTTLIDEDRWQTIRRTVKEYLAECSKKRELPLPLSLSMGYVDNDGTGDLAALISRADSMMYQNKRSNVTFLLSHI